MNKPLNGIMNTCLGRQNNENHPIRIADRKPKEKEKKKKKINKTQKKTKNKRKKKKKKK